jgi:cytochrome c553
MRSIFSFALCILFFSVIFEQNTAFAKSGIDQVEKPELRIKSDTVFYKVIATQFKLPFLKDTGVSGPFELVDDGRTFIFVNRCGLVTVAELGEVGFHLLSQKSLPNSKNVFCAGETSDPTLTANLGNKLLYGVKGMKLDVSRKRMFVVTHSLADNRCLVVKVFEYPISFSPLIIGKPKQIFSTDKVVQGYDNSGGCPKIETLVATQAGGAMALDDKGNLYFGIGDFGSYSEAQDEKSSYGKIFVYNGKTTSLYAMGVRNPQGLYFDVASGGLLETEHGPKGGDEINDIKQNDNLGWPFSSYGIDYSVSGNDHFHPLPGEEKWGSHDFGKKPLFVYLPSIGITDLAVISPQSMFKGWAGSALIASLRGNSIYRVKIDNGRGVYSEPIIDLKQRIRFLRQAENGTLYAKADPDFFFVLQLDWPGVRRNDADADNYASILDKASSCKVCHSPKEQAGIPKIFGMKPDSMMAAFKRLTTSTTANQQMVGIAKGLGSDEMTGLAKYFSEHQE